MWEQFQFNKGHSANRVKGNRQRCGAEGNTEIGEKRFAENKQDNVRKTSDLIRTISGKHPTRPYTAKILLDT